MTIQRCLDLCAKRELKYAGLEAGNQCFCGADEADYDRYGVGIGDCGFNCTGDATQECGGTFRIQVYEIGKLCHQKPIPYSSSTLIPNEISSTGYNFSSN